MSKLQAAITGTTAREPTAYEKYRNRIEQMRPEIAALVGKEAVDRFVRVCLNAVQANPKLLSANLRSLLLASMKAAQDGLMPDGREAVFNIYKTKVKGDGGREEWIEMVQYLPMVHGLVKKLYDAGHVTFVDGVAVNEKDRFEYQRGDEPKIIHVPYAGEDDPGKVCAAYVIAKLKNGETKREVMFRRDIEKVRAASKSADGPGWTTWYDQFAIKSVIKRAYKQLPSSEEFEKIVASDNEAMGFAPTMPMALEDMRDDALVVPPGAIKIGESVAAEGLTDVAAPGPKAKAAGTAVRDLYVKKFKDCKDSEVLALMADETRMFEWSQADREVLDVAHSRRQDELAK